MNKKIEEIKNFWDARPCNSKGSSKKINSREYFDEIEERRYRVEPHILNFADFQAWNKKDVLEIGTGIGTDSINFVRNGANFVGIELSDKSLDICKERFKLYNLEGNLIHGNCENLIDVLKKNNINKKFDLVYSFGVIHHTEDPQKIIDQIKFVLKPEGEARIMLYSKYSFKLFDFMHLTNNWNFSKCEEIIKYYAEAQLNCPKAETYTFKQIKELFKEYNILEIKKDHIFLYDIQKYINHQYEIRDCFKNMSKSQLDELKEEMGWHTLIKVKIK